MARRLLMMAALAVLAAPVAASADPSGVFTITGSVTKACTLGAPGVTTLNVGNLINPSTGTLATISSPPSTTITGSWCNAPSTVSVIATPMVAQHFTAPPPTGFTMAVNYTASVSGWTATPASFATTGNRSEERRV